MKKFLWISVFLICFFLLFIKIYFFPKQYHAKDFSIEEVYSQLDYDEDGIDDYHDILQGARRDAKARPTYKSAYYKGGYPPENEGVCSDLIWRAFLNAGYNLKDLIDSDIAANPEEYPGLDNGKPDPNIDFRRVRNLKVFFDKHALPLTLDLEDISAWQPGDIVIFGDNYTHIGIISDIRNHKGIPYLIHNAGQVRREEDALEKWNKKRKITGHYRFNNE